MSTVYPFYRPSIFKASPTFASYIRLTSHDIHHSLHQKCPFNLKPDVYFFTNHPIRCVVITGLILTRDDLEWRTFLSIDDSSGEILDVVVPKTKLGDVSGIREGMFVEVYGTIDEYRQKRQIQLMKIQKLKFEEEELLAWEQMCDFKRRVLLKPWFVEEAEVARLTKEHRREMRRQEKKKELQEAERREGIRAGGAQGDGVFILDKTPPKKIKRAAQRALPRSPRNETPAPFVLDKTSEKKKTMTTTERRREPDSPRQKPTFILDKTPPRKIEKETRRRRGGSPVEKTFILDKTPEKEQKPPTKPAWAPKTQKTRPTTPTPVVENRSFILDKTPEKPHPLRGSLKRGHSPDGQSQPEQSQGLKRRREERNPPPERDRNPESSSRTILDSSPRRQSRHDRNSSCRASAAEELRPKLAPAATRGREIAAAPSQRHQRSEQREFTLDPSPPPRSRPTRPGSTKPSTNSTGFQLDPSPPRSFKLAQKEPSKKPAAPRKPSVRTLKSLMTNYFHASHYWHISFDALLQTPHIQQHLALVPGPPADVLQKALMELAADGYLLAETSSRWVVVGTQSLKSILEDAANTGVLEVSHVWRSAQRKGGIWTKVGKDIVREVIARWVEGRKGWHEKGRGDWIKTSE